MVKEFYGRKVEAVGFVIIRKSDWDEGYVLEKFKAIGGLPTWAAYGAPYSSKAARERAIKNLRKMDDVIIEPMESVDRMKLVKAGFAIYRERHVNNMKKPNETAKLCIYRLNRNGEWVKLGRPLRSRMVKEKLYLTLHPDPKVIWG